MPAVLGLFVVLAVSSEAEGAGTAGGVVIQPNGEIVIAGDGARGTSEVFGLARYRPNGSLDPRFGLHGKVTAQMLGSPSVFTSADSVALQPDGKIVAAGQYGDFAKRNFDFRFAVARYAAAGKRDQGFGVRGGVTTKFGQAEATADAVVLQPDGKILVAGNRWHRNSQASVFALARYTSDGSLDSSFGTGGRVTSAFAQPAGATAEAVQSDGKIVAVGWTGTYYHNSFALVRYNADGSLDSSFGTGGMVTSSFAAGSDDGAEAVVLQTDGKIVVAGTAGLSGSENDFAIARYNEDGSLDTAFGSGGLVLTPFGNCGCDLPWGGASHALVLQTDGKIVAAGEQLNGDARGAFALARYNEDGSLDTSFGSDGKVTTSFGFPEPQMGTSGDAATAVALQANGKIVATGYSNYGPHTERYQAALARYNTDGSLDTSFGKRGKVNTSLASCVVPRVTRLRLRLARLAIVELQCKVGRIKRVFSSRIGKGRVISQRPRPGAIRDGGFKVRLVVSSGRR